MRGGAEGRGKERILSRLPADREARTQ